MANGDTGRAADMTQWAASWASIRNSPRPGPRTTESQEQSRSEPVATPMRVEAGGWSSSEFNAGLDCIRPTLLTKMKKKKIKMLSSVSTNKPQELVARACDRLFQHWFRCITNLGQDLLHRWACVTHSQRKGAKR